MTMYELRVDAPASKDQQIPVYQRTCYVETIMAEPCHDTLIGEP